jgi:hypothetical protein
MKDREFGVAFPGQILPEAKWTQTALKAIDDGRLAARKVGKHRRIRVYDFNAFARVDHGERARVASALSRDSHATGDYQSLLPLSDADWTALKPRGVASSA